MYADIRTDSMKTCIGETERRRRIQEAYNEANGITPESVRNAIRSVLEITRRVEETAPTALNEEERAALMRQIEEEMLSAARAESRPFSSETPTDSSMKRALTRRAYPMFLLMTFQFISCRGS